MNEKIHNLCSFISTKIPTHGGYHGSALATLSLSNECGYFPIHYLSASGYVDYLRLYLEVVNLIPGGKILIDIRDLNDGSSALHYAVTHGQIDITRTLIQAGASVNIQNFEGKTPLFSAVSQFKENNDRNLIYDIVKALLYHGANPNIGDENGVTPLHIACSFGIVPLVELLIDNGAWVNIRDDSGDTPIFYALREGKAMIVERLVECGVNVEDTNEDGETPLEFCQSIEDEEMVKLIIRLSPVSPYDVAPGNPGDRLCGNDKRDRINGEEEGDNMDIDHLCSLSSSAGSRTKLEFSFTPDFVSSQTAF